MVEAQVRMTPSKLDGYTLQTEVGEGATAKVFLAQDAAKKKYAIKVFYHDKMKAAHHQIFDDECNVYQNIDHDNIIKIHAYEKKAMQKLQNGTQLQVSYIVQEYVAKGEFFEYLLLAPVPEHICRYYFNQMLHALHYFHQKGACHRDLKPENMLLDANYNLKLIDFGFAAPIEGRDGKGLLTTDLGTPGYMAPEIREEKEYKGHEVDLFALGVILFIMYAGHPPFNEAHKKDPHFKYFYQERQDCFWNCMKRCHPANFFSDSFVDLMTNMLAYDPNSRLSMAEIIGHPWMSEG